jgi:hypothetical protein
VHIILVLSSIFLLISSVLLFCLPHASSLPFLKTFALSLNSSLSFPSYLPSPISFYPFLFLPSLLLQPASLFKWTMPSDTASYYIHVLKVTIRWDLCLILFLRQWALPKHLIHYLKAFLFWFRIKGDIRNFWQAPRLLSLIAESQNCLYW